MLTGFKVSFTSKCVFYRSQHEANGALRNIILKFLEWDKSNFFKDEINQQIELKKKVKKMGLKYLKNGKNHVYFQSYCY